MRTNWRQLASSSICEHEKTAKAEAHAEDAKGNRSDSKDSAAKEISTANEAAVMSNRNRQVRNRSQVAVSHRRKPKASCNRAGNGDGND